MAIDLYYKDNKWKQRGEGANEIIWKYDKKG